MNDLATELQRSADIVSGARIDTSMLVRLDRRRRIATSLTTVAVAVAGVTTFALLSKRPDYNEPPTRVAASTGAVSTSVSATTPMATPTITRPVDPVLRFIETNPAWLKEAVSPRATSAQCAYDKLSETSDTLYVITHCISVSGEVQQVVRLSLDQGSGDIKGFQAARQQNYAVDYDRIFPTDVRELVRNLSNNELADLARRAQRADD